MLIYSTMHLGFTCDIYIPLWFYYVRSTYLWFYKHCSNLHSTLVLLCYKLGGEASSIVTKFTFHFGSIMFNSFFKIIHHNIVIYIPLWFYYVETFVISTGSTPFSFTFHFGSIMFYHLLHLLVEQVVHLHSTLVLLC